jgi:hypothetical protein
VSSIGLGELKTAFLQASERNAHQVHEHDAQEMHGLQAIQAQLSDTP